MKFTHLLKRKSLFLAFFVLTLLAIYMLFFSQEVYARTTAQLCDSGAKYWCGKVDYSSRTGGWTINTRWWEGGWGYGGARSYQLWLSRDWESINNTWVNTWACAKPCSAWYDGNGGLDRWRTIGPSRNVVTWTTVQYQEQYFDCGGGCHYWCEPLQEHYLWNASSLARNLSCN